MCLELQVGFPCHKVAPRPQKWPNLEIHTYGGGGSGGGGEGGGAAVTLVWNQSRQFLTVPRGAFWSISKMHHFRSFGDYEFWANTKSRYRSLANIVKITQERAFLINFLWSFAIFPIMIVKIKFLFSIFAWKTAKKLVSVCWNSQSCGILNCFKVPTDTSFFDYFWLCKMSATSILTLKWRTCPLGKHCS